MRTRNPRLTLRPAPEAATDTEPRTLKFPGGVRDVITGRRPSDVTSAADLAANVERTLERMQERLDALHHEVNRPFRLPISPDGSWDPSGRPAA